MSIASDVSALKDLSDDVVANKVSRFAYTEQAYTDNEADGVTEYDVNADQNIPVGTASIMKVNQTVIEKGWRSRASSITRMLMNHFLGRISYNLNKVNDWFNSFLGSMSSYLGAPNGIATLDQDGRIPYSQLPESAIELKGYWDASTNTPTLADGTGTTGDEYIVSVAGTRDLGSGSQYFAVGDRVLYAGGVWKNISGGSVRSVCTTQPDLQGNVDLYSNLDLMDRIFGKRYGKTWKKCSTNALSTSVSMSPYIQIAQDDNGFMITTICNNERIACWSDDDGETWNTISNITVSQSMLLKYEGSVWYLLELQSTSRSSYYSLNGKDFYALPSGMIYYDVIFGNNKYVFGTTQGVKYATDGHTLQDTQITSGNYRGICYVKSSYQSGQGIWLAGGYNTIKLASDVSGTWLDCVLPTTSVENRTFNRFVLVKNTLTNSINIYTVCEEGLYGSRSGTDWHKISTVATNINLNTLYAVGNFIFWRGEVDGAVKILRSQVYETRGFSTDYYDYVQSPINNTPYNMNYYNGLVYFASNTSLVAFSLESTEVRRLLVPLPSTSTSSYNQGLSQCICHNHKLFCIARYDDGYYAMRSDGFIDLINNGYLN